MKNTITSVIGAAGAIVAPQIATTAAPKAEESRPNFIIILADDQGYQDLGCFGSPKIKTPNIDRMAQEGMRLTNFYAQPVSGPSRQSLMTGCYPIRCARKNNDFSTRPPSVSLSEIMIPEILKEEGYTTHMIGKWDLAGHNPKRFERDLIPIDQGYDTAFWTPASNDKYVDLYSDRKLIEQNADMSQLTRRYTDDALRFIEESADKPFMLYLAHTMPHVKLAVSDEFKGRSDGGLFGDVVEEIDYNVGRILDLVKELGIDDNTYIIYTSDNGPWWIKGENAGHADPLRGAKTSTWDGGMRVPCVIRAPGRVPSGASCDLVTSTIDILPTITTLAGGEVTLRQSHRRSRSNEDTCGQERQVEEEFFLLSTR